MGNKGHITGNGGAKTVLPGGLFPVPLTDPACRNAACPPERTRIRLTDGGGLYLEVAPNGSKRWFWKYLFGGKEKRLALGGYPGVSLKAAREARDEARKQQRGGTDPVQNRLLNKLKSKTAAAVTFEAVARDFHATRSSGWSERYGARWMRAMETNLFPWIGQLPLADITAPVLLQALRRVEARGTHDAAHALRAYAGQVFRHGIATDACKRNPVPDLAGSLKPVNVRHMAAVLDPDGAGALLRAIYSYTGQPTTRAALVLSALLFQRPGNMRHMEWDEVDLEAGLWAIPSAKMKRRLLQKVNGRPHIVPLPPQAVEVLKELKPLTGHGQFVFPSLLTGERPMSENTVRAALRRMGYSNEEATAHGFRAMARTLLVERLNVDPDVIEAQLAHGKSGPLGMAYDRAEFMEQRRQMMSLWADYLDQLREGAAVIAFKAK